MAALSKQPALIALVLAVTVTAPACGSSDASGPDAQDTSSFIAVDPASASPTDRAIAAAQARLKANASDDDARVLLAQAYLQKARETGDPSLYVKAEGLLGEAKKTQDENPQYWITRGTLQLAQHNFNDALSRW